MQLLIYATERPIVHFQVGDLAPRQSCTVLYSLSIQLNQYILPSVKINKSFLLTKRTGTRRNEHGVYTYTHTL